MLKLHFFLLFAKTVFGSVQKTFDVRLVLDDDEQGDCPRDDQNAFVDVVMRIGFRGQITESGKSCKGDAGTDAAHRNVFGGKCQGAPYGKREQCGDRSECQKNAECGQNALAAAESRKACEAVPQNGQKSAGKGQPKVIGAAGVFRRVVQPNGDSRGEESFEKVYDDDGNCRFDAQNADCVRQTGIFGTVLADVVILTVYGLGDPDGGRNGA